MTSSTRVTRSRKRIPKIELADSVAEVFEFLGRPWVLQLLFLLGQDQARFSDLKDVLPSVSARVLTERLRELCDKNLVVRTVEDGPPTLIRYRLSDRGRGLLPGLLSIEQWAETVL